jgi:guanylate kinase
MANPEAPRILIASGTICSGKTTLIGSLVNENAFKIVSAITTRAARAGDFPGEYTYLTETGFDALNHDDMMWATKHGAPSARYTLLRSTVRAAIADTHNVYTRPLSVSSATNVLREFGADLIKVIYLPTPDPDELARRAKQRGDDPANLAARVANESDWDQLASETPGFHIANGRTPEALHAEALSLMEQK